MRREDEARADPRPLRWADPTLPDRFADMTRPAAETEWTRRALDGWQDPEMLQRHVPSRMEIEHETGVAFFRGAPNALAFSFVLAALIGLYVAGG